MRFASKRACSLRDDFLIVYKLITIISCITTFLKMKIQRENNINLFQNLLDFSHFLQFLQIFTLSLLVVISFKIEIDQSPIKNNSIIKEENSSRKKTKNNMKNTVTVQKYSNSKLK